MLSREDIDKFRKTDANTENSRFKTSNYQFLVEVAEGMLAFGHNCREAYANDILTVALDNLYSRTAYGCETFVREECGNGWKIEWKLETSGLRWSKFPELPAWIFFHYKVLPDHANLD